MKKLVIIASPSGCGKDTVVQSLLNKIHNSRKIVTTTTRDIRPGEVEGKNYYYTSKDTFTKLIHFNSFIEWEEVHGELYGTRKDEFQKPCDIAFAVIDVFGAMKLKSLYEDSTILIFLKPPSKQELIRRLKNRSTETDEQISKRMDRYDIEIGMSELFDHVIINDELSTTVEDISEIINRIF